MQARIRSIKQCAEELKKLDENTAITEYFIRQLVLSKQIPSSKSGVKHLINLDVLLKFLEGGLQSA